MVRGWFLKVPAGGVRLELFRVGITTTWVSYRHHNSHYDTTPAPVSEITIQIKGGTLPVFFF